MKFTQSAGNFKDTDMANYVTAIYEPFNLKRFPIK
jgi:hypothetical protein